MACTRIPFIFAFAFAFALVGTFADEPEKLVNGIPTTIEQNPHAISLRMDGSHFCGGSIIGPRHIITAGHCVINMQHNPAMWNRVTVVTGTTYLNKGGQSFKVARMFVHESYKNTMGRPNGFDIAIIKLTQPITFNQQQRAIALPRSTVIRNEPCTIVAWGGAYFRGPIHNDLQKLDANVMLSDECQQRHSRTMQVHKDEFCTLIRKGTGACNGDSGSGVIRNSDRTIIGLVSGGIPCAEGYPDVFTTVYSYLPWINQKMAL